MWILTRVGFYSIINKPHTSTRMDLQFLTFVAADVR